MMIGLRARFGEILLPSLRFENLVAGHLLKWTHHEQDVKGRDVELRYFRDTDRKVRFPKCEAWQISAVGTKDYVTPDGIRVAPAMQLLRGLI